MSTTKTNGRSARAPGRSNGKAKRGKATKARGATMLAPLRVVERPEPRSVPDSRAGDECRSRAARLPDRPLDAFLIHDRDSFDPGNIWTPQISEEQWEAAELLLSQGYVLGVCANDEEAVILAACVSRKIPFHTIVAYDGDDEIFWVVMA